MSNFDMKALQGRAKGLFDGFTPGQRAMTVIAVMVALVGGVAFYLWASKPAMSPVVTNLSAEQSSQVTTKLTEFGVPYELDGTSTVLVPHDKVDAARIQLAGAGALPTGGKDAGVEGYSLLDKGGITSSDFQQRMNAKRATEGELQKAIQALDTVERAKVQLAIPDNDVFANEQNKTKASVMVTMKPTKQLSSQNVEAIVNLVGSAVPKLDPADVSVTDSTGKLLNAPGMSPQGTAGSDAKLQQIQAVSAMYTQKVQALVDRLVGAGNASVLVNAELDFDNKKIQRRDYTPQDPRQKPQKSNTTTETFTGSGGTPVGGVLGPDNNYNQYLGGTNSNGLNPNGGPVNIPPNQYRKGSDVVENPLGWQDTAVTSSTGAIKRLGYSVMLNSKVAGSIDPRVVEQQVNAAINFDAARGDKGAVNKLPFETATAEAAAKAAEEEAAAAQRAEMLDLGKNVGLGLLLALALLLAWLKSRKKEEPEPEVEAMPELLALPAAPTPYTYELDHGELPVLEAVPVDPQSEARIQAREEVGALVDEDAEEVARLLRGWIGDRK